MNRFMTHFIGSLPLSFDREQWSKYRPRKAQTRRERQTRSKNKRRKTRRCLIAVTSLDIKGMLERESFTRQLFVPREVPPEG